MAATFKGGHNGVNHNHNDLGTFSVAVGGKYLIYDPGAEIYTNRTFSKIVIRAICSIHSGTPCRGLRENSKRLRKTPNAQAREVMLMPRCWKNYSMKIATAWGWISQMPTACMR
jgi:hypothetical protein